MRKMLGAGLSIVILAAQPASAAPATIPTGEADRIAALTAAQLSAEMASGKLTSERIVRALLDRIARVDDSGPTINAVLATMPDAVAQARRLDAERRAGKLRGPLHGVPVLLKDNVEADGPLPTTAGSLALAGNVTRRDAPLVKRLRAAGAVILGKTNLSEWANFRSEKSTSGWSAVGGLTHNPHAFDRNTCGSSSGSGAGVAAMLAPLAVGTETDGSIVCPASVNGIVGFKPTVGFVSRTYVVPISHSQDTAGPMTRSVADAAAMLAAMAGSDPADAATAEADAHLASLAGAARADGLKGVRIGVLRDKVGDDAEVKAAFERALDTMRAAGAILVDVAGGKESDAMGEAEYKVLQAEFKADLNAYLATTPASQPHRTLTDLIAFNKATPAEMLWFDQSIFDKSQAQPGLDDPAYIAARETSLRLAGAEGIDKLLTDNKVALLVQPSNGPVWKSTLGKGDSFSGPSASTMPAIAGYPHLTVPEQLVRGLPVGVSFIGTEWADADVLAAGLAYESARGPLPPPAFAARADQ